MRALKNLSLAIAQLRFSDVVSVEDISISFQFFLKYYALFFGNGKSEGYHLESSAIKAILSLLNDGPMPEKELLKKLNPSDEVLVRQCITFLRVRGDLTLTSHGLERVI